MKIPLRFGEKANLTMCIHMYIYKYINYIRIYIHTYIYLYIKNDRPLFTYPQAPSFVFRKRTASNYLKKKRGNFSFIREIPSFTIRLNKANANVC